MRVKLALILSWHHPCQGVCHREFRKGLRINQSSSSSHGTLMGTLRKKQAKLSFCCHLVPKVKCPIHGGFQ
jgi:hypothetical protein